MNVLWFWCMLVPHHYSLLFNHNLSYCKVSWTCSCQLLFSYYLCVLEIVVGLIYFNQTWLYKPSYGFNCILHMSTVVTGVHETHTQRREWISEAPAMASTKTIGHMQEFNPASETVLAYLERFELFITANAIEEEKLVLTLLTVVRSAHYSLLHRLVSPDLPKDKSFSELVDILKKHYDPEPIVIAECFRFFLMQPESRRVNWRVFRKSQLACQSFKLGNFLLRALRDSLVCGMQSEHIQKVLLMKAKMTLEQALEISQGIETATL